MGSPHLTIYGVIRNPGLLPGRLGAFLESWDSLREQGSALPDQCLLRSIFAPFQKDLISFRIDPRPRRARCFATGANLRNVCRLEGIDSQMAPLYCELVHISARHKEPLYVFGAIQCEGKPKRSLSSVILPVGNRHGEAVLAYALAELCDRIGQNAYTDSVGVGNVVA